MCSTDYETVLTAADCQWAGQHIFQPRTTTLHQDKKIRAVQSQCLSLKKTPQIWTALWSQHFHALAAAGWPSSQTFTYSYWVDQQRVGWLSVSLVVWLSGYSGELDDDRQSLLVLLNTSTPITVWLEPLGANSVVELWAVVQARSPGRGPSVSAGPAAPDSIRRPLSHWFFD